MYLDVIFFENLIINYLILSLTQKFSKKDSKPIKLFLGALLGACYVLIIFLLPYKMIHEVFAKIILSLLIIYMAFTPKTLKEFLRILAVFYLISFAIGGTIFAVLYTAKLNLHSLWIGILIAILLFYTNWDYIVRKSTEGKMLYSIKIEIFQKQVEIKGLLDTGNRLYDPLTKAPVVVVEFSAMGNILPDNMEILLNEENIDFNKIFEVLKEERWLSRIRLIPFISVGQSKGIMLGFKPDKLVVGEKEVRNAIVGIYKSKIGKDGNYAALLTPEILV
ncbi:stage II sporulation protein GA (sporulation sigma-E factor processing peptidase) [Thermoanaerobacter uzonensis DSM 18761]|uniref:Sporulation sigma-E factor-processing peptidase n=1 Tax=Thermoanaerobacter uzonensis DSM 18761 TaxID=1123369 RepID=A0A1M4WV24_9THEO|nr:sigma-E processing peptidase SpoIIGA [Thermoanaerobacter uzonensis]SHE84903.1 stage II sporulation protein GA (sporulation sigma-E factor processing peptidase) [Thermoanaerobacter uzonensis DSM 18761]